MGGKTKQTSNSVQLPGYLENAYKGVLKAGANVAKAPQKQYTGPRTAGFTPDQETGFGMIRSAQGAALPYINAASSMYSNVGGLPWGRTMGSTVDAAGVNAAAGSGSGGLNWGSVPGSTVDPSGVNAAAQGIYGNLDYSGLPGDTVDWGGINAASGAVMPGVDRYDAATMAQYMDPYLSGVVDPLMERMAREDAKQVSALKGSGISMGLSPALGDRMGLAASDLAGQQALARNQTLGQLYSQGFQNAQSQLNAQQQLQLQGGTSDQARLLQAAQLRQQGRQADADRILSTIGQQGQFQQQDASRLMEAQNLLQSGRAEDAGRALQSLISQGQFGQQDADRLMQAQTLLQQGRQEDASRILQSLSTQQQGQLGAAQGMAGLGQAAQDSLYQGIDYLMNSGQMQQQLGQQQLDQAYNDWNQRNNYARDQVDWLANLIYGSPGAAGSTTTTTEPGPSVLSQLLGLGTTALGLGRTFGSSAGGRVRYRDLGGAIVGDENYSLPRTAAPTIDTSMFTVPQNAGTPSRVPTSPGVNLMGRNSMYINALKPLNERILGAKEDLVTELPRGVRRPFNRIAKGVGSGGGGGSNPDDIDVNGGRGVIRRWPDGTIKSVGGKPVKHKAIGGGLLPEPTGPAPGTEEYDAAVIAELTGGGGGASEDAPAADVGMGGSPMGAPMGARRRSRSMDFFSNLDPLVYAGLGIMGGESPFPLTNVGQGGAAGLKLAQDLYSSELDQAPTIDDSGPTIRYWMAGEGWTDTGIPSYKWVGATTSQSDGTEKERYMEGKYGAGWRKDPAALAEFEELLKTPDTMVDMRGAGAFATENAKKLSENMFQVIDGAAKAASLTSTYGQLATLLSDPNIYTGTGGETVQSLKRAASTLFGLEVEGVAAAEVAQQTKDAAIGSLREEVLGPGVMSESDRRILEGIFPGLSTSAEGIQLAYELQKINAQAAAAKAQKLQEIISRTDGELTTQGWFEFQNWVAANPFFTPEVVRDAQARAKEQAVQTSPTAGTGLEEVKKKWGLE